MPDCEACNDIGSVRDPRLGAGGALGELEPCPVCTPRPCPFCGGEAKAGVLRDDYDEGGFRLPAGFESWDVQCRSCHANISGQESKSHAVAKWNRRT